MWIQVKAEAVTVATEDTVTPTAVAVVTSAGVTSLSDVTPVPVDSPSAMVDGFTLSEDQYPKPDYDEYGLSAPRTMVDLRIEPIPDYPDDVIVLPPLTDGAAEPKPDYDVTAAEHQQTSIEIDSTVPDPDYDLPAARLHQSTHPPVTVDVEHESSRRRIPVPYYDQMYRRYYSHSWD